jgi:hypothetical protein
LALWAMARRSEKARFEKNARQEHLPGRHGAKRRARFGNSKLRKLSVWRRLGAFVAIE